MVPITTPLSAIAGLIQVLAMRGIDDRTQQRAWDALAANVQSFREILDAIPDAAWRAVIQVRFPNADVDWLRAEADRMHAAVVTREVGPEVAERAESMMSVLRFPSLRTD
jgi:hypothetical protein